MSFSNSLLFPILPFPDSFYFFIDPLVEHPDWETRVVQELVYKGFLSFYFPCPSANYIHPIELLLL